MYHCTRGTASYAHAHLPSNSRILSAHLYESQWTRRDVRGGKKKRFDFAMGRIRKQEWRYQNIERKIAKLQRNVD